MGVDVTKILVEGSVFGIMGLVMMAMFKWLLDRRESASDTHLTAALLNGQTNFQETLKIAVANTAALTQMTETLEQLADAVHASAEISRASAETVRDLVKLLSKGG